MYFPYLRGRQYDLLAIKALVQNDLINENIVPVIEPVKMSSTLANTIQVCKTKGFKIALILNPVVGDLESEDINSLKDIIAAPIMPAIIMNKDAGSILSDLEQKEVDKSSVLIVLSNPDYVEEYKKLFTGTAHNYTLFPDERGFRRAVIGNKVLFEDKFHKLNKNADYAYNEDEFFSDDHIFYESEGYKGFGDYSIIGKDYEESGFAPRAVAIHIVYIDKEKRLRVHHFVSDSNYGIEDIAGKYYEAVLKLKKWVQNGYENQITDALSVLIEHASTGYFPGLPTIKKLSIMHHLELVRKILDKEFA